MFAFYLLLLVFTSMSMCSARHVKKTEIESLATPIETALQGIRGDNAAILDSLNELKEEMKTKPDRVEQAGKILNSVGSALKKLKSNDAVQIISGCLDMVSGIASTFGGPVGMGIGAVASFISSILGLFTGNAAKNSIASVIDNALNKHRDEELQGKAAGAKREFAESSAFIGVLKRQDNLTSNDLSMLAANVPIYRFSEILGVLETRISQGSSTTSFSHAKRTVDFILLYLQLVIMRETMLLDLALLYRKPGIADHMAEAVESANEVNKDIAKNTLEFLHDLRPDQALVGAVYHPIDNSETSKLILNFTRYLGVSSPRRDLYDSMYKFENVYWSNYGICSEAYMGNYMFRSCYNVRNPNLQLRRLSSGHYTVENRQGRKIYITKHQQGWAWGTSDDDPSEQGHLIIIPIRSGRYMVSTKKWPNWFMYMESSANGYIRSWENNPGPQGHWLIN